MPHEEIPETDTGNSPTETCEEIKSYSFRLPVKVVDALKILSDIERRSMTQQLIIILEASLSSGS